MKRLKLNKITIIFVIFFANKLLSNDIKEEESKNLITSNLFSFIPVTTISFFSISYLRAIDIENVLGIEIKLPIEPNASGFSTGLEHRYYLISYNFNQLYIASRVLYSNITDKLNNESIEVYTFSPVLGWQITGKHFNLDLGIGLEYNTGPYLQSQELEAGTSNILPHIRLGLGWKW